MIPFASRHQTTIDIPFDPPHTVTIRKLPGRHLQRAALENQFASIARFRKMGGAAFQKELESVSEKAKRDEAIQKAQADPLNGFDPYVLMMYGIVAWTYPESLKVEVVIDEESALVMDAAEKIIAAFEKKTGSVSEAAASILAAAKVGKRVIPALEDLDDEAVEFFAREILKFSKPSLFRTEAEEEAARKND